MEYASHDPDRWAQLRFSIIGPLLAAPPGPRQGLYRRLRGRLAEAVETPVNSALIHFSYATLGGGTITARRLPGIGRGALRRRRQQRRRTGTPFVCCTHPGAARRSTSSIPAGRRNSTTTTCWPWHKGCGRWADYQPMAPSGVISRHGDTVNDLPKRDTPGTRQAERRLAQLEVRSYEGSDGTWRSGIADLHHGSPWLTANGRWVTPCCWALLTITPAGPVICSGIWTGRPRPWCTALPGAAVTALPRR